MATLTPVLGLQKPATPADDDLWGPMLNANADKLDAAFSAAGGGLRNRLINGGMDLTQRNTSFVNPVSAGYTLDRWQVSYDGTGATRIIQRAQFAAGSSPAEHCRYYAAFQQAVAGSGGTVNNFQQRIEGVRTLAGKAATLSFWATASAALTIPGVFALQSFGTGGAPSAAVGAGGQASLALTTGWQRYTIPLTIPSIAGKTIGTNGDDCLYVYFGLPLNTTFAVSITGVQLEPGNVTPLEYRPAELELLLAQRYFSQTRLSGRFYADAIGRYLNVPWAHPRPMRATPTATIPETGTVSNLSTISALTNPLGGRFELVSSGPGDAYCLDRLYSFDAEL